MAGRAWPREWHAAGSQRGHGIGMTAVGLEVLEQGGVGLTAVPARRLSQCWRGALIAGQTHQGLVRAAHVCQSGIDLVGLTAQVGEVEMRDDECGHAIVVKALWFGAGIARRTGQQCVRDRERPQVEAPRGGRLVVASRIDATAHRRLPVTQRDALRGRPSFSGVAFDGEGIRQVNDSVETGRPAAGCAAASADDHSRTKRSRGGRIAGCAGSLGVPT